MIGVYFRCVQAEASGEGLRWEERDWGPRVGQMKRVREKGLEVGVTGDSVGYGM